MEEFESEDQPPLRPEVYAVYQRYLDVYLSFNAFGKQNLRSNTLPDQFLKLLEVLNKKRHHS